MQTIDSMKADIQRVMARYNAENDTIPNAPAVTWSDNQVAEVVYSLIQQVQALTYRVATLEDAAKGEK